MDRFEQIPFEDVDITGGFWQKRQRLNADVTIYAVRDRFEETGRFKAFEFGWKEGSGLPKPRYSWDSNIAKWIESAAYILQKEPKPDLEAKVDEVVDLIEEHQEPDGYFNIYFTVVEPGNRFALRTNHELYNLGHLIEAGIAYYRATGKEKLLNLLDRYVDLVIRVFTVEHSAGFDTPGHEEIELALIKLYRLRKDRKYLDLAMYFLNERGKRPEKGANSDRFRREYSQSHLPVREQTSAAGHCVRGCYLYSAMADAAKETGDGKLLEACRAIFDDITTKKMYITGGIGSTHVGEAFTLPYDLPNDTAYNETCASIALSMFADRMKEIDFDSRYADIVELEMYNGVIAGLSLDGKSFFYENPLEINLADRCRHTSVNEQDRLSITQRVSVFQTSCCPPNVTRYVASVGGSVFSVRDRDLAVHQFMTCEASFGDAKVSMKTDYPADGKIRLEVREAAGRKIWVRIPGWCRHFDSSEPYAVENGYAAFSPDGDHFVLDLEFRMEPVFRKAHPAVRADRGKSALTYGPLVYCLEAVDNGERLWDLSVDRNARIRTEWSPEFGANVILAKALRDSVDGNAPLYSAGEYGAKRVPVKFIPYFAYENRGETDMTVWFRAV